jgi:histone H3/H4
MGKTKSTSDSTSAAPKPTKTSVVKTAGTVAGKAPRKPKASATPDDKLKFKYARLPRAPLLRMVKDMAHETDPDARVQANLLDRVEQIVQETIADLISSTVLAARKEKRKTMMVKDLDFIMELRSGKTSNSMSLSSSVSSSAQVSAPVSSTPAPTAVAASSN